LSTRQYSAANRIEGIFQNRLFALQTMLPTDRDLIGRELSEEISIAWVTVD
jgi:hypothetical protein